MAHYENLPIYKKAFELAVYIEQVVKGFSRYHKYTIGSDLRNLSRNLAALVVVAGVSSCHSGGCSQEETPDCTERKALFEGQPYIVVAERGYYPAGLKKRVVTGIKI